MEKVDYYSQVASSGYYLFRKITLSVLLIAAIILLKNLTLKHLPYLTNPF